MKGDAHKVRIVYTCPLLHQQKARGTQQPSQATQHLSTPPAPSSPRRMSRSVPATYSPASQSSFATTCARMSRMCCSRCSRTSRASPRPRSRTSPPLPHPEAGVCRGPPPLVAVEARESQPPAGPGGTSEPSGQGPRWWTTGCTCLRRSGCCSGMTRLGPTSNWPCWALCFSRSGSRLSPTLRRGQSRHQGLSCRFDPSLWMGDWDGQWDRCRAKGGS